MEDEDVDGEAALVGATKPASTQIVVVTGMTSVTESH